MFGAQHQLYLSQSLRLKTLNVKLKLLHLMIFLMQIYLNSVLLQLPLAI
jgi:hypothetical protein